MNPDPDPAADTDPAAAERAERARALPKVVLHDHLDGSLRPGTLLDLLRARGLPAPAPDVPRLSAWFTERANAGSLPRYLEGFALTVAAMASPAALARVAREAAEDAVADGARLAEFRVAPLLFEAHGLAAEAAIESLLEGLATGPLPLARRAGLIVCALRHGPEDRTRRAAELALRYRDQGVIGFDLAGPEQGFPPSLHAGALGTLREAGMPLTLHAGEADVAERVIEAARLGAARIGHGVRLADALADPARRHLVEEAKARGLHLELCPTSNVHTGAAPSIAAHPITALWRAGVACSYQTDNRLISMTTHAAEAAALLAHTPLTEADLLAMAAAAARASFLPAMEQAAVVAEIEGFGRGR
jgi:adenosine deaminase